MSSATIILCIWVVAALQLDLMTCQEFETTNGRVRGRQISVLGKSLDVFHGIPFAKPPIGDLRFKHPKPAESWRPETRDATKETPSCLQTTMNVFPAMSVDELRSTPNDFSEDCLYLSIWKPTYAIKGTKLAVMVWIYGGGFFIGSTRVPLYNGQYLAAQNDVIVVSINYRLGSLGFAFLGPDTIPGNMGMMDQVEALKWVKDNIGNFGGDNTKITLFGESAGAMSVGFHMLSPLSKDLFNNGILQSSAPLNSVTGGPYFSAHEARENIKKLAGVMNCTGSSDLNIYECLKAADSKSIIAGFDQASLLGVPFFPVVDGYYLPADPATIIKRKEHKKTKLLTGITKDEGSFFIYGLINPATKTLLSTGERFSYQDFQTYVPLMIRVPDKGRTKAITTFYESEKNPPLDYLDLFIQLSSDFSVSCPTLQFCTMYAESNDVYLYSVDRRISTMPFPEWMGVPHMYDIDFVFGHPLNDSLGSTQEDKELSIKIMKYWTNFAKSDNPNIPPVTTNWTRFDPENQSYLSLDVGNKLENKRGFRRHQCAFTNDILPMIPKDKDTNKPVPTYPPYPCVSGSRPQNTGSVPIIVTLLTVSHWMLIR